ncbi:MAG: UTP--glucose-1-phosphate uridylyltransferase [Candidatus Cloacimonetes bacterium]|jgi:UTP--glucose-1-phosphate uridylyltransferase|nr:UTP--glucose-1-phosphate uridylyltransferase [Candidatus Cloacimonadota bacterium]MBT6993484.1 UTP--glucose-1-phosphate uridylyltransferase [Candidatus Cloacimonadota bacterium]MBT7468788.1 UTP--glucose-1-phosphate uridylyltransferase [Candidatus Cloacimonadota bacterium]
MKSHLKKFIAKMEVENPNELVIQSFTNSYYKILEGATGKISENEIEQPASNNLTNYDELSEINSAFLGKLAVIKLNGGLGTSMGLNEPKSLIKIKNNLNFLDIIARQILHLRNHSQKDIPLLFMHSFNTRKKSLDYLKKYSNLKNDDIPLDFMQNKFPKIKQSNLSPLNNQNENLNWNPPGHGEIYLVLAISGILDKLIKNGFEYVFISNADNLGAVVDEKILTHFASNNIPFLMEVCNRTEMDKKGGHLAQTKSGQLLLRESAQCPKNELENFQNIDIFSYFNTNNLWINLKSLKQRLYEKRFHLPLSMILNSKTVDGEKVYQVESAMGSAISVFKNSKAIIVNRNRFIPVKTTNDLLIVWSDVFRLSENFKLISQVPKIPKINLDTKFYQNYADFEMRFQKGVPSLKKCNQIEVNGDVFWGENVKISGKNVKISHSTTTFLENITLNQ